MKKLLYIGWKDLRIMYRDYAALILVLAAPLAMTLGLGLITGQFSGSGSSAIQAIPVVLVNHDDGMVGRALVETFRSQELSDLLQATVSANEASARQLVADDQVAAAVVVPAGFTGSIIPDQATGETGAPLAVEVYANPGRPISVGVVRSVLEEFTGRVETGRIAGQVAVTQLVEHGLLSAQDAPQVAQELALSLRRDSADLQAIDVQVSDASAEAPAAGFDPIAILAPGFALLFLMYTVSLGGRSILAERQDGTLARMLVTPTTHGQVLLGKVVGVYLVGVAQMAILIVANGLLFRLRWGDPLGVLLLVLATSAAATGWGVVLAAVAKTPSQVSNLGMTVTLVFGLLGGSFFGGQLPPSLQVVGKVTPNAWGIEGFTTLAQGGTLSDLLPVLVALVAMAVLLLAVAIALFSRQGMLNG